MAEIAPAMLELVFGGLKLIASLSVLWMSLVQLTHSAIKMTLCVKKIVKAVFEDRYIRRFRESGSGKLNQVSVIEASIFRRLESDWIFLCYSVIFIYPKGVLSTDCQIPTVQ